MQFLSAISSSVTSQMYYTFLLAWFYFIESQLTIYSIRKWSRDPHSELQWRLGSAERSNIEMQILFRHQHVLASDSYMTP